MSNAKRRARESSIKLLSLKPLFQPHTDTEQPPTHLELQKTPSNQEPHQILSHQENQNVDVNNSREVPSKNNLLPVNSASSNIRTDEGQNSKITTSNSKNSNTEKNHLKTWQLGEGHLNNLNSCVDRSQDILALPDKNLPVESLNITEEIGKGFDQENFKIKKTNLKSKGETKPGTHNSADKLGPESENQSKKQKDKKLDQNQDQKQDQKSDPTQDQKVGNSLSVSEKSPQEKAPEKENQTQQQHPSDARRERSKRSENNHEEQLIIQKIILDQLLKQQQEAEKRTKNRSSYQNDAEYFEMKKYDSNNNNNDSKMIHSVSCAADIYAEMGDFVSVTGGGGAGDAGLTDSQFETPSDLLLRRTKSIGMLDGRKPAVSERVRSCKSIRDLTELKDQEEANGKVNWTQRMSSIFRKDMVQQQFTEQQKKTLSTFSSLSYTPTHSIAYVNWISEQSSRLYHRMEWDRWFLVFLIGVSIGLVAALLKQSIQALNSLQWRVTKSYLQEDNLAAGFWFQAGLNCSYVLVGSFLVTFIHPPAVGGGTPEVLAYLNGIIVHGTLSLKNLIVKFCGNVLAVAGGLPAATQAPIITYGAIIGAGVGQFQSKKLGYSPKVFTRFRNPEDRRQFTTNGVAAGVSAGFNAPIGGLLFAMEDLSSFWSKGLSWQTFFCCVVATAVAQMFNTAFTGFKFNGSFGGFNVNLVEPVQIHLLTLIPAAILGLAGGLLGAFFTRCNTFIGKHRRQIYAKIKGPYLQRSLKMLEPVLIAILMTIYTVFLPLGFSCQTIQFFYKYSPYSTCNFTGQTDLIGQPFGLSAYNCPDPVNNETQTLYNPMATLIQGSGTSYLDKLWSRGTYLMFDWYICLAAFAIFFPATVYTAGTAIAGGIFVPVLICGSLLGRALGVAQLYIYQAVMGSTVPQPPWLWLDPGVSAAVGAAGLLAGVNRLAVASTVIVVEMVGDIYLVIPIMMSIFVSKMVADLLSKPLYKYMLDAKALPFLEQNPQVFVKGKQINMEMSRASDVMSTPVETIHIKEMVAFLAYLLLNTSHGAFPVVKYDEETKTELAYGLITRIELYIVLCCNEVYEREEPGIITPNISAEELSVDYIADRKAAEERIRTYTKFDKVYSQVFIDLDRYINMSMPKIDQDYSLLRTYLLFRTLGLRHLVIIDVHNRVVGMITRKDLMQFNIEEKLRGMIEDKGVDDDDDNINDKNDDEEKVIMTVGKHEDRTPSQASLETPKPQGLYVRQTGRQTSSNRLNSSSSFADTPDNASGARQVTTIDEEEDKVKGSTRAGPRRSKGQTSREAAEFRQSMPAIQVHGDEGQTALSERATQSANITLI